MDNIYIISLVIAFVYLLAKFVEMRVIKKESTPLKELVTDTIFVFVSVVCGDFIFRQMQPLGEIILGDGNVQAFTDNPTF